MSQSAASYCISLGDPQVLQAITGTDPVLRQTLLSLNRWEDLVGNLLLSDEERLVHEHAQELQRRHDVRQAWRVRF